LEDTRPFFELADALGHRRLLLLDQLRRTIGLRQQLHTIYPHTTIGARSAQPRIGSPTAYRRRHPTHLLPPDFIAQRPASLSPHRNACVQS
jgi:hypothetical protein